MNKMVIDRDSRISFLISELMVMTIERDSRDVNVATLYYQVFTKDGLSCGFKASFLLSKFIIIIKFFLELTVIYSF